MSKILMLDTPTAKLTWADIKYFKPTEFDSPDLPGSGEKNMSLEFVKKIDTLRELVKRPLFINSGYRTLEHHKVIYKGRPYPNSAHLRGLAVDIRCLDSNLRFLIISYAIHLGINRIEDASSHVHLDIDKTLPQDVLIYKRGDL